MTEPSRDDKQPSYLAHNPWVGILGERGGGSPKGGFEIILKSNTREIKRECHGGPYGVGGGGIF